MDLYGKITLPQGINRIESIYKPFGKELYNFIHNILNVDQHKRPSAEALLYYDYLLDEKVKKKLKNHGRRI
ncbi:hypothetical protein BDAP_000208 [Binucleata daphniae]